MKKEEKEFIPDLILCSDLHLRATAPKCRIDDFWGAQEKKILILKRVQKKYKIPIICAGDVFDKSISSPFLERWAIENLPKIYAIPGQHDLLNHNLKLYSKTSFSVLEASRNIELLSDISFDFENCRVYGVPYGEDIKIEVKGKGRKVLVLHRMVYKRKPIHKSVGGKSSTSLLKKYSEFDLIVTGDNHKFFVDEFEGRLLVNCGSMMRIRSYQVDYSPQYHLWSSEENKIKSFPFPIEEKVMDIDYVEKEKKNNEKLEKMISKLKESREAGLSFTDNVSSLVESSDIRKEVVQEIYEAIEN